jgi:hypothetical protein
MFQLERLVLAKLSVQGEHVHESEAQGENPEERENRCDPGFRS